MLFKQVKKYNDRIWETVIRIDISVVKHAFQKLISITVSARQFLHGGRDLKQPTDR